MKKLSYLLLCSLMHFSALCQEEFLARVNLYGPVTELGVSPSETLWAVTRPGNIFHADNARALWHSGGYGSKEVGTGRDIYDHVDFFNDDVLMVSGFISGKDGKKDVIIRSEDKGRTWQQVRFGTESWIDAAYVSSSGKAWMTGSSQFIYYSENFGKTWEQFDKVEARGNLRFTTIHFSPDEKTGLFGSTWDVLYRTTDNCKTWERLPSPLMQQKYTRISRSEKPEIRKIRITGNYYFVEQENRIFYTGKQKIDWIYLPDAVDFETAGDTGVYIINKDLSVRLLDAALSTVYAPAEKISGYPVIRVKNNKLFALTDKRIYEISPGSFYSRDLFTDDHAVPEPSLKLEFNGEKVGFEGDDILKVNHANGKWYRYLKAPYAIQNAVVYGNGIVINDPSLDNHLQVDLPLKKFSPFVLPAALFSIQSNPIAEFTIEEGKQVHTRVSTNFKQFKRSGNTFHLEDLHGDNFLPNMPDNIHVQKLQDILVEIDRSKSRLLSVEDLQIRHSDIIAYKKLITKEENSIKRFGIDPFDLDNFYSFPGEGADFNFYRAVADSLDRLNDKKINEIFSRPHIPSGSSGEWKRLSIVFNNGDKLVVEHNVGKPNYLYMPWSINYKGLVFKSSSVQLSRLINELTLRDLLGGTPVNKNYAIFQIADHLYREQLGK